MTTLSKEELKVANEKLMDEAAAEVFTKETLPQTPETTETKGETATQPEVVVPAVESGKTEEVAAPEKVETEPNVVAEQVSEQEKPTETTKPSETHLDKGLQKTQRRLSAVLRKLEDIDQRVSAGVKTPETRQQISELQTEADSLSAELDKLISGQVEDPVAAIQTIAKSIKAQRANTERLAEENKQRSESQGFWSKWNRDNPHLAGKGEPKFAELIEKFSKQGYKGEGLNMRATEDFNQFMVEQATKPATTKPMTKPVKPLVNKQVSAGVSNIQVPGKRITVEEILPQIWKAD